MNDEIDYEEELAFQNLAPDQLRIFNAVLNKIIKTKFNPSQDNWNIVSKNIVEYLKGLEVLQRKGVYTSDMLPLMREATVLISEVAQEDYKVPDYIVKKLKILQRMLNQWLADIGERGYFPEVNYPKDMYPKRYYKKPSYYKRKYKSYEIDNFLPKIKSLSKKELDQLTTMSTKERYDYLFNRRIHELKELTEMDVEEQLELGSTDAETYILTGKKKNREHSDMDREMYRGAVKLLEDLAKEDEDERLSLQKIPEKKEQKPREQEIEEELLSICSKAGDGLIKLNKKLRR